MEWDWWSRMQGPSSQRKGPARGKWWANLRNPVCPQPNSRWHRRRPQSFGVLPDVDLDSVHVKTLDEILREREAKKCREQAKTLTCTGCGSQETTRGDLRMVQCQDQNPVHRIRLSQYNFHREDRDEDEEDEMEVVAMDTAESDEGEEIYFSPEELYPKEPDEETIASSLQEEGYATALAEEERVSSERGDLDILRVDVEYDKSCQETSGEDIDNLDCSRDDFDPDNSERSIGEDTDVRSQEGECKIAQVEAEIDNSDQEDMDADEALKQDDVQVDGGGDQNCKEENEIDVEDVDSSLDELFSGELEIDIDEEAESASLEKECKVSEDWQGIIHSERAIKEGDSETVEQGILLVDPGGDGNCLEEVDLDPSENVCLRELKNNASQVTNDGSQDRECTLHEGDKEIVSKEQEIKDEEVLLQDDLQMDVGYDANFQEDDKDIDLNGSPDEVCPKEPDGSINEETSRTLQEKKESPTVQVEKKIINIEKIDKEKDAEAVEPTSLQVDAGGDRSCQEEVIEDSENSDGSQDELHLGELNVVDKEISISCQEEDNQDLEAKHPVKTRADNYQQNDNTVEITNTDTKEEKGEREVEIGRKLDKALDESSQEDGQKVFGEDVSSSIETDKEEREEDVKVGIEEERHKGTEDDNFPDESTQDVADSSEQSQQDTNCVEKLSDEQSLGAGPGMSLMVDDCRTHKLEAVTTLNQEENTVSSFTTNGPVDAPAEREQETRNAATTLKMNECLPRALQDKDVITPQEAVNPVEGDDLEPPDVPTVNKDQIKTTTRPYTRKRKCEEMMQGLVKFLKVRQRVGVRIDAPRKARDKSTGQRRVRNDKVGQGAMVKDKQDREEAFISDIPEVPQTRQQHTRVAAEPKRRGRPCSRPKKIGEGDSLMSGQTKEKGIADSVVTPCQLRKRRCKERGEDESKKQGQTNQVGPDAEVAPTQRGKSRSKDRVGEFSMKKGQTDPVGSDVEDAPSRPRKSRPEERGKEVSKKQVQKEVGPDSEVAPKQFKTSRRKGRGEEDSAKQGQTRQVGPNSAVAPRQLRNSRHRERKTEDSMKKGQTEQFRPDSEVDSSQPRRKRRKKNGEEDSINKGQIKQVGPDAQVAQSQLRSNRPKEIEEKDSRKMGQTEQDRPDVETAPSQIRKSRSKGREEEDSEMQGQTEQVEPDAEVASSQLSKSRSKEKEENVSIKKGQTKDVRPDAEVAPSQLRKKRPKERREEDSAKQGQTKQAGPNSPIALSLRKSRDNKIKEQDSMRKGQRQQVVPYSDFASNQHRKSRPQETEKITVKKGQTEQFGHDAVVAPIRPRKSRRKERGEEDSVKKIQTIQVGPDARIAQSQLRSSRPKEREEEVSMKMGQTEQDRPDVEASPSQIRKSRSKERNDKDSQVQGQTEQVRPDARVAPSQIKKRMSRRKVKDIQTNHDQNQKDPEKRLKRCRSRVNTLVVDGKQLRSCLECSDHAQKGGANLRQLKTGEMRVVEEGDNIQRKVKKLKGDGCVDEDTLPTMSPSTETVTAQKRGNEPKQSTVSSLQPPSKTVVEAADVNQSSHVATKLDKVELKKSSSALAANERQVTESDAAESPCQESIKVKRGSTKRRGIWKEMVSKCLHVVSKKRRKRKRDGNQDLHSPGWEDGGSSSKKQKRILKIKIPSPKYKQALIPKSVPCSSPLKDSTDKVDSTSDSVKNIFQDRRVNQEKTDVDMPQDRVPYLETSPKSNQNLDQDDRENQQLAGVNAVDQRLSKTVRLPFLDATPESDQNLAQDLKVNQELEVTIADHPRPETGRVPYLDATPDSDRNLVQDIQVNQESEGGKSEHPPPETSRVPYLDVTSDSDQNVVQEPRVSKETEREKADQSFSKTSRIPCIDATLESDQSIAQDVNKELKEVTSNQILSETSKDPNIDATPESDRIVVQEIRVDHETEGGKADQSLSETIRIPFAQILANQPRVLLCKLNFKVSIPLDCITLKTRRSTRRGRPRKMTSIAKKAQKMTRGLKGMEGTWNQLGFRKPSQLIQPGSEALSDESFSVPAQHPSTSQEGHSIPGQERDSAVATTYGDSDSLNQPVRTEGDADYLDCSGEIVEAPEVAHTVEIVSTDGIPPPTTNGFVEVAGSVQERLTFDSENSPCDQESCQLCTPDDKSFDYELENQVQIISSEYEAMGLSSSEDGPDLCFTSASMKVVVTALAPSGCADIPLVSLTSTQSGAEEVPGYPHTLPPMQIFLSKMTESGQTDAALQTFARDLGENLSIDQVGVTEDVRSPLDAENEECTENSPRLEAGALTQKENSETEAEVAVSHQERMPQSPESRREDEDRQAAGSSRVEDSKRTETEAERIQATTIPTVTSPPSQDISDCFLTPNPQPPMILSASPELDALLSTIADTSFGVAPPQDAPSTMLEQGEENVPENHCKNLAVPDGQKMTDYLQTPQNDASSVIPAPITSVAPPATTLENEDLDSRNASSQFGDLTLPPLGEDFEFPEEDCISLDCDTESFLNDLSDELTEIDRKISDAEKRTKSGSPSQCRNRPLHTADTNDQLGKSGPSRKEIATPREQPSIHTVDWSEVEQYQPISRSLAGGDCSTNDLRRFIRKDEGHSVGTQDASQPTAAGRNWSTTPSHFQGSVNTQPQPVSRNQVIPRGFCYDFVRNGRCLRRTCPYVHSKPKVSTRTQVNECNMALGVHLRGRHSNEQGCEDRETTSLDSEGNASPAAIFEAAYLLQQCSSWRETRETLIDICQRKPEVASCRPVVQELMDKLRGSPEVLGEKFGNFVAVFKRYLAENASDPATDSLKQALSRLGVSSAMLCCNNSQWHQARYILDCLYNQSFPCPVELAQNVLLIQQLLSKHQPPTLQEGSMTPCAKGV
ncbi:titin homolog isoform X2 [Patiria miniata]|uniref:C3H1-type domain-containing protein n=1 Tax=Patiria miniata TaxID=46514 RepID=A0A914B720_PATMI|nr:titin homolog isoform X2 [Patiria miniata]